MEQIEVRVLFFGKARELTDVDEGKIVIPTTMRYEALKKKIFHEEFPELKSIETSCILAVDQRYANNDEEVRVTPSSEIAIIPPLSGG